MNDHNVCTVNEVPQKKCGGPIPIYFQGDCKICGKKDLVLSVNQWITACHKCWLFLILPRRK